MKAEKEKKTVDCVLGFFQFWGLGPSLFVTLWGKREREREAADCLTESELTCTCMYYLLTENS